MGRDFEDDVDEYADDYRRYNLLRDPWVGEVDERVYAAFRIAFSSVAFINLIQLWAYRDSFFTSGGMIPAEAVAELGWHTRLSIFTYIDSSFGVAVCFLAAAAAMVCLGLGISPRAAAFVVLVWHVSYTYRAEPGLGGWDYVLRAYSFLILVSPLGRCWSVRGCASPKLVPNYGISLMRVQLAVIYWQSVVVKLGNNFWQDGEFLTYFLMSNFARWPHERVAG